MLCAFKIGNNLIDKRLKLKNWCDKELQIRRLYSDIIVREAIKKYAYDVTDLTPGDMI
jgi:hypothetical protein